MKKKLIIILILFAAVPLLVSAIFSLMISQKKLLNNANQISMDNVSAVQYEIKQFVSQDIDLLHVVSLNDELLSNNPNTIKALLSTSAKAHPELDTIAYCDPAGQQLVRSDKLALINLADRDYFKDTLKTGKTVVSNVLVSKSTGHDNVLITYPVLDANKKIVGVLTGVLDLTELNKFVSNLSKDENTAFILESSGKILAHPDKALFKKDLSSVSYVKNALAGNKGTDIITENGKKMIVAYAIDPLTGWVIANEKSYDTVMKPITDLKLYTILIIIITLAVAIGFGYYLSVKIANPITALTSLMKQAANGDLTIKVDVKGKDEIGQLIQSFNQMISNIRQIIERVGSSSEQVASSSEELTASALQSGKASEQVAHIVEEVAAGTDQQLNSINNGSASITEMISGIQNIAAGAETASTTALETSIVAEKGNEIIRTAVDQMNSIFLTVNSLVEVVQVLVDRSEEIAKMNDLISDISTQTHLLSLNAAIESARAGEFGRGFAVVALEVRKLAEQSSRSANQINQLISSIKDESANAIRLMKNGSTEVQKGIEVINISGTYFEEIEKSINEVTSKIQEVSAASQKLSDESIHIVSTFDTISEVAGATSDGMQNVSASTEEQLASMEEIASSAASLSQMAEELQGLVTTFKVHSDSEDREIDTTEKLGNPKSFSFIFKVLGLKR